MKVNKISFALTCTLLATLACEASTRATAIPTFDPNSIQTAIVGTAVAAQTQTRAASTDTPTPTNTLLPTDTPTPTETPTPLPLFTATALPQPITYEGTGDKIIKLPPDAAGVLHIVAEQPLGLDGLTETNEASYVDLLVHAYGFYDGRVPLNLVNKRIVSLRIGALGSWKIIYYPLGSAYDHVLTDDSSLTIRGDGDDVWLSSLHIEPEKLHITWEQGERWPIFVNVIGLKANNKMSMRGIYESQMYWYETDLGELLAIAVHSRDKPWKIRVYP